MRHSTQIYYYDQTHIPDSILRRVKAFSIIADAALPDALSEESLAESNYEA
jgi:hypothetical protein